MTGLAEYSRAHAFYNWVRWLDGDVHVVTEGRDVTSLSRFRAAAAKYGARHGIVVITRDVGCRQAVVRSLGPVRKTPRG